ncbi:hypothetical protein BH11PSE10_BH11PSE10_01410 [soil metagenome]
MFYPAFFHHDSGCVRFWVDVDGSFIGATIRQDSLHHRYHPRSVDDDPLATYLAHAAEIDDAVRRRVASGSIEPVMLRALDLPTI